MVVVDDVDGFTINSVTGNAGEQDTFFKVDDAVKLYDANGIVLETVLGGVDVTGTLDVSGTITGNVTGNLTGNVSGNLTGDVTGDLSGNVTGGNITTDTKFVQTGTSTNLLAGSIKMDATNPTLTLQASVNPGNATIQFLDNSSNVEQSISANSNNLLITTRAGEIIFNTAQTLAATIDVSQNATFAGSITSTGLSVNAGTYHKVIATFPSTYVTNLQIGQQFNINNDAFSDTVTFAHTGTEAASDFIFTIAGNEKLKIEGDGTLDVTGNVKIENASANPEITLIESFGATQQARISFDEAGQNALYLTTDYESATNANRIILQPGGYPALIAYGGQGGSSATSVEITTIKTNAIEKKTTGSPIIINSGLDTSLGLKVYYDMMVYNTLSLTDASWNIMGRVYANSAGTLFLKGSNAIEGLTINSNNQVQIQSVADLGTYTKLAIAMNVAGNASNLVESTNYNALAIAPYRVGSSYGMYFGGGHGSSESAGFIQSAKVDGTNSSTISLNPFGGNVGINTGTSDPSSTLFVNGSFKTAVDSTYAMGISNEYVSTYVTRTKFGNYSSASNLEIYYDISGTEEARITRNYSVAPLKFMRGTTTDMIIDGAGKVGIGTPTPSTLLSLSSTANSSLGGISLIGNSAGDKSNIWTQDIYSKWLHTESATDAAAGYGRIDFETNAALNSTYPTRGGFSFTTAGAGQFVTFTNQGRVGINTETPDVDLQVTTVGTSSQDGIVKIGGSEASLGLVLEYDQANATVSYITANPTYTSSTSLMKIRVDGDTNPDQLVLKGDGKIGIGNNTPLARLTIGSSQGKSLDFSYSSDNGYINNISNYWNSSIDTRMDFNIGRTANVAPVTVMSVGYNSYVGIGTIVPGQKLEVNVVSGDGILIKSSDVATFKMKGSGGTYNWGLATTNLAASDFGIYKSNAGGGDPITAGTAQVYFTSTGSTTSNATFSGNIIGNSGSTTEVGAYPTGGIKRIRMGAGGEIHFGDTTTGNALGLTEGTWDQFTDTDRLGLYCRNELKIYGNSNSLMLTMASGGNATFAGTIQTTGANLFYLGKGVYTKAINASNDVDATNIWGYGLYEGAAILGELSTIRDGTVTLNLGTTYTTGKVVIRTDNKVTALTIDASQNATFAGTITSGNITLNGSSRALTVISSNDQVPASFKCSTNAVSTIGFQGNTSTSDYHVRIGVNTNDFVVYTNNIIRMTINSSGNTTFAGNILIPRNAGAIEGNGYPGTTYIGSGTDATTTYLQAGSTSGYKQEIELVGGNAGYINFKTASTVRMQLNNNALNVGPTQYFSATVDDGPLRVCNNSTGSSTMNRGSNAIQLGPKSQRTSTANLYYGGITWNGLMNYSNGNPYDLAPHVWVGSKYKDFPGSERSSFVVGVKSGVGNDGSGTNIPQERLVLDYSGNLNITGTFTAAVDVIAYSDKRLKENIKSIKNPLEKVLKLKGINYNRIDDENKIDKIGFIAQDVKKILPEVVREDENYLGINYGNITAILVEAIKEQQKQIVCLQNEINKLKNK